MLNEIRPIAGGALVRKEDLEPFPGDGCGAASKKTEQAHAAFREKSLLRMPRLSLGTTMATCSPLRRRAASK